MILVTYETQFYCATEGETVNTIDISERDMDMARQ